MKKNCWEVMKCGREDVDHSIDGLGLCPTVEEVKLDGIHDGKNGGRSCWMVAGTYCGGLIQGTYAQKHKSCILCDFYKLVRKDEGLDFKFLVMNNR
ncbi:MAG: two-CW domain-containing protein [Promethearchaeota archaeon]|jgi:hypothetical protein